MLSSVSVKASRRPEKALPNITVKVATACERERQRERRGGGVERETHREGGEETERGRGREGVGEAMRRPDKALFDSL